ncbi:hypothetical protein GCM10010156_77090 [Planobispora rosea]|nr:hypothetical protein GCM10010156_77090 [Planobispora rosea]
MIRDENGLAEHLGGLATDVHDDSAGPGFALVELNERHEKAHPWAPLDHVERKLVTICIYESGPVGNSLSSVVRIDNENILAFLGEVKCSHHCCGGLTDSPFEHGY